MCELQLWDSQSLPTWANSTALSVRWEKISSVSCAKLQVQYLSNLLFDALMPARSLALAHARALSLSLRWKEKIMLFGGF